MGRRKRLEQRAPEPALPDWQLPDQLDDADAAKVLRTLVAFADTLGPGSRLNLRDVLNRCAAEALGATPAAGS